jgi:hypothetical protein
VGRGLKELAIKEASGCIKKKSAMLKSPDSAVDHGTYSELGFGFDSRPTGVLKESVIEKEKEGME